MVNGIPACLLNISGLDGNRTSLVIVKTHYRQPVFEAIQLTPQINRINLISHPHTHIQIQPAIFPQSDHG